MEKEYIGTPMVRNSSKGGKMEIWWSRKASFEPMFYLIFYFPLFYAEITIKFYNTFYDQNPLERFHFSLRTPKKTSTYDNNWTDSTPVGRQTILCHSRHRRTWKDVLLFWWCWGNCQDFTKPPELYDSCRVEIYANKMESKIYDLRKINYRVGRSERKDALEIVNSPAWELNPQVGFITVLERTKGVESLIFKRDISTWKAGIKELQRE